MSRLRDATKQFGRPPAGLGGTWRGEHRRSASPNAAATAPPLSSVANLTHRTVRKGPLSAAEPQQIMVRMEPCIKPATSPPKGRRRTLQGVLRERLPQIEAALSAGYRMRPSSSSWLRRDFTQPSAPSAMASTEHGCGAKLTGRSIFHPATRPR